MRRTRQRLLAVRDFFADQQAINPIGVLKVTHAFVYAILVEVTLSYLGLTDESLPQIGGMLLEGREAVIYQITSVLAVASLSALLLVVAGFSLTERGILRAWERKRR